MAVGLFNPFFDRAPQLYLGAVAVSGGVISMVSLMLKGVLCLTASFLLIATTPIDSLCAALRRLHVPSLLVTLLLLTYRYVGVMTEEVAVMTDAYRLRAPGQKGIHISAWGSFLGQLLLRSMWGSCCCAAWTGPRSSTPACCCGATTATSTTRPSTPSASGTRSI